MWNLTKNELRDGYRFTIIKKGKIMSFREVLESLRDSEEFCGFLVASLQALPFEAYRWETPAYNENTLDHGFEFVALNAPSIDRRADSKPFESYMTDTSKRVVVFQSLGKDAHLVVPSNLDSDTNYCHLGSFTNTAPISQQRELWGLVGRVGIELASDTPIWISTAGGGVAWLHVRFDTRPKYYHYVEFKKTPNKRKILVGSSDISGLL